MPQDFSGQNLQGRCFKGQDLTGANFERADLRGTDFSGAILAEANFRQAKAGLPNSWRVGLVGVLLGLCTLGGYGWAELFLLTQRSEAAVQAASAVIVGLLLVYGLACLLRPPLRSGLGWLLAAGLAGGSAGAGAGALAGLGINALVGAAIGAGLLAAGRSWELAAVWLGAGTGAWALKEATLGSATWAGLAVLAVTVARLRLGKPGRKLGWALALMLPLALGMGALRSWMFAGKAVLSGAGALDWALAGAWAGAVGGIVAAIGTVVLAMLVAAAVAVSGSAGEVVAWAWAGAWVGAVAQASLGAGGTIGPLALLLTLGAFALGSVVSRAEVFTLSGAGAGAVAGVAAAARLRALARNAGIGSEAWSRAGGWATVGWLVLLAGVELSRQALAGQAELGWLRRWALMVAMAKGTSFQGADLTGVDFSAACLPNTDFRQATLAEINWTAAQNLEQAQFTEATESVGNASKLA
ncbi:pentapeptide repeat-containing protein [Leptolyngbya sp. FACHB-261]|uniref:pentapeptide repeat-containing protein n=1 Tax=Leptolyngbya sp. FACHB-261 TaxID=2692806 RepID=UPI001682E01A|nr:pentapeptide repeat-containing protein [Leptolyngbya sp. FACHB-261]MBD2102235.1 pentapeptide repeat-containing protein [Leptolyngbya sp. FACHB-261]